MLSEGCTCSGNKPQVQLCVWQIAGPRARGGWGRRGGGGGGLFLADLCKPRGVPRKLGIPQSRLPLQLAVVEQDAVALAKVRIARHLLIALLLMPTTHQSAITGLQT